MLSDGVFNIQLKYLESKIGTVGRPRENKAARIGWNAWCCGDETSEMDSGTVSSRMDESVSAGKMRKTILGKESPCEWACVRALANGRECARTAGAVSSRMDESVSVGEMRTTIVGKGKPWRTGARARAGQWRARVTVLAVD